MKRYIRTTDNKFYDTTKERYLIDDSRLVLAHEYETHPTMSDGNTVLAVYITKKHVEYINCGTIANEADEIYDILQIGDLINYSNNRIKQIENDVIIDDIREGLVTSLAKIYTKQGDDYKLVWSKDKGVI